MQFILISVWTEKACSSELFSTKLERNTLYCLVLRILHILSQITQILNSSPGIKACKITQNKREKKR